MPQNNIDLAGLFQSVTQSLAENQQTLNQADEYNQNHGSNMVQTFQTITNALQQKQGSSASTALAYASKQVSNNANSGSSRLYAQNLAQAAGQFKGQKVDPQGALQLLQTLVGTGQTDPASSQPAGGDTLGTSPGGPTGGGEAPAQQTSPAGGDMLGALLGGLTGDGEAPAQQTSPGGGDMLGVLLGGLTGGTSSSAGEQSGLGMGNLLNAGMAFLQARQSGGSNVQALAQAFLAGSGMGNAPHRTQSTQVVVNSFLQALGTLHNQP